MRRVLLSFGAVLAIAVGAFYAGRVTDPARQQAKGVYICSNADNNPSNNVCARDGTTISTIKNVTIAVIGKGFSDGDKIFTSIGPYPGSIPKNQPELMGNIITRSDKYTVPLGQVVDATDAPLKSGRTYQVRASDEIANLGTAYFQYTGASINMPTPINAPTTTDTPIPAPTDTPVPATATPFPTITPTIASSGRVHVCTFSHYDQTNIRCLRDDTTINSSDFGTAKLVWTPIDHGVTAAFVAVYQKDGTGKWVNIGQAFQLGDAAYSQTSNAMNLLNAVMDAGVYNYYQVPLRLEVDEDADPLKPLGTVTIAITP